MQEQLEARSFLIYERDIEYLLATMEILTPYKVNPKIGEVYGEEFVSRLKSEYPLLFEFYANSSIECNTGIFELMLEYDMKDFSLEKFFGFMKSLPREIFVSKFLGISEEEAHTLIGSEAEQVSYYQRNKEDFKSFFAVEVLFQKTEWLIDTYYKFAKAFRTKQAEEYLEQQEKTILEWKEKIGIGVAKEGPLQHSETIMGKSFHNRGPYEEFYFMPSVFLPLRCCRWFARNQILIFNVNKEQGQQNEQVSEMLKMLSDKTRYKILVLLKEKKNLSGIEIAEHMGLSASTVSHHMSQLKNSGLVHEEPAGNTKYYSINEHGIKNCIQNLEKTFL